MPYLIDSNMYDSPEFKFLLKLHQRICCEWIR